MIKYKLKNAKGISLISLAITVIILIILTNAIVYNIRDNLRIKNLENMQNDIANLKDKISNYYAENGKIPATVEFTNNEAINAIKKTGVVSDKVDTGKFLVIDLSAIDNLTLNYGKEFEIVKKNKDSVNSCTDLYIINEDSHNIFYVAGIKIENDIFYTNYTKNDIDKEAVNLRYINNIKIPEGYYYDETREDELVIKSNDDTQTYKWTQVNDTINSIPEGITTYTSESGKTNNIEDFIKSINTYKGYYKSENDGRTAVYLDWEKWSLYYDKEGIYKDKNGDTAYIPKDFCVSETVGQNTIEEGLVVKDKNNNEWVWIQVPRSIYEITVHDEDYEGIEKSLKSYASPYSQGNSSQSYIDEWYNGCGISSPEEYNQLKNRMLQSIYNNGGFYIGRYETGIDGSINNLNLGRNGYTSITTSSPKAIIQKDAIPYNFVTCSESQSLAKSVLTENSERTTSLLFGIQWDLVCKFLEEKGVSKVDINLNNGNWGNYNDTEIPINSTNAKQFSSNTWSAINGTKSASQILLSTGASNKTMKMNICDLAGNEWEWTLEHTKENDTMPCRIRGGGVSVSYEGNGVNCRSCALIDHAGFEASFRVALY